MPHAAWTVEAPAKINLHLGVHVQRDGAGYHRVDSVMAPIGLTDALSFEPAPALAVEMDPVPASDIPLASNSVYRAAVAMGAAFGRPVDYAIRIEKRIPMRAGLGGPSTDAAAVIAFLCARWGVEPTCDRALEVARGIGADVPFFLYGQPAYLDARGDMLAELFESLPCLPLVLVKPRACEVTTVEAYRRFDEAPRPLPPLEPVLRALRAGDAAAAVAAIGNNLAPVACELAPEIAEILSWLRGQPGVRAAEVSGSGACSFAVCDTPEAAAALARAASARADWWVRRTQMEKSGRLVVLG